MSRRKSAPRPTDAELSILRVLWRCGPSTVREVHEQLSRERPMVYTTVLKLLQIMTEKGLVTREDAGRAHIYQAAQSEEYAQRTLVGDLLDRVFGGSAQKLVLQALTARKASPEELAEIRKLLDELEGGES
ncbi:MAG TPA: BlaI/MecI/CopY family transcriptional regulator [Chthonomonadaceae bacterium]|nr:BlaI/MecI/CopY family transcriptional regulator [Chthonomonadaceae bacterium]